MRLNKLSFVGILFLFGIVLLSMNFVSADLGTTFTTPANNANVTGTITFNASVTGGNVSNATFYWFSAGWVQLCQNTTANATVYTCSYNTGNGTITDGVQVFNVTSVNTTLSASANATGVVVDNTAATAFFIGYTNGTIKLPNTNLTINISVVDINMTASSACKVNVNGTNQTFLSTAINATYRTCNTTTLSLKNIAEGNQTINVYANNSVGIFGLLSSSVVFIDGTGPQVDLSLANVDKTSITLNIALIDTYTATSSCTVDRSGATVSGITSLTESGLNCATSYTYVVTCTDVAGNTGSATETFSTNACGGVGVGGAGGPPAEVHSWTTITPGAATIMKDFDAEIGVKQIEITVNNEAQNVKVTVTKYDGKPAAVSVSKSGKVYQYLQISEQNLGTKLDKAKVQFRVEKSWASSNSLDKAEVSVYKFDETSSKWNELTTTFASEDSTYYYYDAELDSFSYFAISEKSLVAGEGTTATGETPTEGRSLTWLWILIALVIVVVVWLMMRKRQ